ncbi:glycosyltransferase family 2 protein [Acuticoccus mangrovi]|uniref:Glycosyltransferase family 2 protein n=1 Tax=Acuticoccus mangrovi TaxID=2796142 RepID=A0A934MFS2_9HYPH|nr:glycosyltransferase family A protein [Acuticoccus mangrovi]MBJ3775783.1 glycosyltransferase family 2 protein [Acuticoccus mangrovi]
MSDAATSGVGASDAGTGRPTTADRIAAERRVGIDIIICTFHREDLLVALLASIGAATADPRADLGIIVVDNSDGATARRAVASAAPRLPYPVRYVEAHPPNISVARNAGIAASKAEFVAFLDDDQAVVPTWIRAVRQGVARLPYDGFFGPVEPIYGNPDGVGPIARGLYEREPDLPDGTELAVDGPERHRQGFVLATSNCILRRAAIPDHDPFDFYLGANGGEDLLLFHRMHQAGSRFGWLAEAGARDVVPASRTEPAYLRRRLLAGGQSYAWVIYLTAPDRRLAAAKLMAGAAVKLVLLAAAWCLAAVTGSTERRRSLAMRLAGQWGKLTFFSRRVPLYRHEDATRVPAG